MSFTARDGVTYLEQTIKPYASLVEAHSTDSVEISQMYKAINSNLLNCFQPFNFYLADGVVFEAPGTEGFVSSLQKDAGSVDIKIFGSESLYHIADSEYQATYPQNKLLVPAESAIAGTSYFITDNRLTISNTEISSWKEEGTTYIKIVGEELQGEVEGDLVGVTEDYITVMLNDSYRTYSLTDQEYNLMVNKLPNGLSTIWDEELKSVLLLGIHILKDETPLLLNRIYTNGQQIGMQVATVANPDLWFIIGLWPVDSQYFVVYERRKLAELPIEDPLQTWRKI